MTAALLVAMMVTAVEQLVVSPAMTTIIAAAQGLRHLSVGHLGLPARGDRQHADLREAGGPLRTQTSSAVRTCALQPGLDPLGHVASMGQLIAMRTIQGLGAGAVGPIVLTMLGDLFTLNERAQVQGLFSAVWGLSSVGGPLIGGYLTDHLGWQWVFLVCVPFALAAIVMLAFFVSEPSVERKVAPIDWAGAGLADVGPVDPAVGRARRLAAGDLVVDRGRAGRLGRDCSSCS